MEGKRELFGKTSLLLLYEHKKTIIQSVFRIDGHKEMTKEELVGMGYPNPKPRKKYMGLQISPVDEDLILLNKIGLVEKLIEMNPKIADGTSVIIEP